jgi:hypothetical protein
MHPTLPSSCRALGALIVILAAAPAVLAQEEGDAPAKDAKPDRGEKPEKKSPIKKYAEVITEDAKSDVGLFSVHRVDDKLYYEIPPETFGVDMLWVTSIAQTTAGSSYAGMPVNDLVVRWEQRGEKVLLRSVRYGIRAETDDPIAIAVEESNVAPIIQAMAVQAYGKDKAPVIDVTSLFTKDIAEFSAKGALGAGGLDGDRTFIESAKAFPINVEIEVTATYNPGGERPGGPGGFGGGPSDSGITAVIHHSMVKLPERPMAPRRWDSRVGFFSVGFEDYADDSKHEVDTVRYVTRWRLEKKDAAAAVSEPVQPIVFYVGRETPQKWQPYVKAGIEMWQPAFEAAGFRSAIIGKLAPDPNEDPDWDPEDARISSIRWLPSNVENAFGPHVHDPRTGEILEADVRMFHNVQKLVRDWYFVQAAATDERARKLPMPDDLMGLCIQFVVAHEVGHSLGFPHNMKASSSYSIAQLRDPEWTAKNGTAPSIMDYARFNYVAQPGDGAALMPRIGPYDHFAVEWGYRQFADGADEKAELEVLAKKQIAEPMLRFGGGGDPTAQTEDLSSDAIEATRLGTENLKRIAGFLVDATSRPGADYDLLSDMHAELLGQWSRELGHVTALVGGVEEINLYYGDADQRYFPVGGPRQRAAVEFLLENAMDVPEDFVDPNIVLRLTGSGVIERITGTQLGVLRSLLSARRLAVMAEHAERMGAGGYAPSDLFADLTAGIFRELEEPVIEIGLQRRHLQQGYVRHLVAMLADAGIDGPALARAQLESLRARIPQKRAQARGIAQDHLADLLARIEEALDVEK